ncbi:MAG: BON domain-containing protein [Bacteroidia bacterium]
MFTFKTHNDAQIQAAVTEALQWHNSVRQHKIQAKVKDGWLTLEGEVEWEFQKVAARCMVENIEHLRGISNNIKILTQKEAMEIRPYMNCFAL